MPYLEDQAGQRLLAKNCLADLATNLDPGRAGWAEIASQNGLADLATNLDFHSAGYRVSRGEKIRNMNVGSCNFV